MRRRFNVGLVLVLNNPPTSPSYCTVLGATWGLPRPAPACDVTICPDPWTRGSTHPCSGTGSGAPSGSTAVYQGLTLVHFSAQRKHFFEECVGYLQ